VRLLLLDEGFVSGAATALGLHAAGCAVDVLAAVGGTARCGATGGVWRFAPRTDRSGDHPTLAQIIANEMATGKYDVVYPTTEPLQRLLWSHRRDWPCLVLPTDDDERPIHLADKRAMSRLARRAAVRVPDEIDRLSTSNIDETIRALGLPIVIKGVVGRGGQTTFIASSAAEVRDALRRIARRGTEAFAQRYIDGPTFLVGGVFHRGTPLRLYAGEKRVQFPDRTGPAAVLVSSRDDALLRSATRIFQAVGLTGLASADFIRDANGRFHFLELNPRPWGSIAAARDAGVDLFGPLAALWQGANPTPDLEFSSSVRSPVVPLALAAPTAWLSADAWRALGAAGRAIASGAVPPRLAMHLGRRALRVARNW
jgi:hypothetical protein